MTRANKYGLKDLQKQFPTDDACLDYLFTNTHSNDCSCGGTFKRVAGRKQYQCSRCRFQVAPTAGTIFHKSDTPLTLWFHAIFVFSNAKSGISAKEMERQLGVTYKTAWRMLKLIREALGQDGTKLGGDVEMDSAYFGGKGNAGKNNENLSQVVKNKAVVFAAIERGGNMKATVMPDNTAKSHGEFLTASVDTTARLLTDSTNRLKNVATGFDRHMVDHHRFEFVRGDVHVNNVESFWAHAKRSIKGTHKVISKKYLQAYLDGFVFHYNNRHSDKERFVALFGEILHA
jgi:transposase